jgi:hypothetical protein
MHILAGGCSWDADSSVPVLLMLMLLLLMLMLLLLQMAPELLLTGKQTKAADVYSMGMLSKWPAVCTLLLLPLHIAACTLLFAHRCLHIHGHAQSVACMGAT